jgi:ABC-2 type transport system permease protein
MSVLAIARKDLELILRDPVTLIFTLLVPIVVITIVATSLVGGRLGIIPLPVVNEDEGPVAEVFIEALGEYLQVEELPRAEAEARVLVDKHAAAVLILPERMSKRYLASQPSTIKLLIDPAKGAELDTIRAFLMLADRDAAALADPFSEQLLDLEEESLSGNRLTTDHFEQNIPGFSLMFVLMGVMFSVAFGLEDERSWGTLSRLRIAPIATTSLLGGKLLARYLVGFFQLVVLFLFGHALFDLSLGRSMGTFFLLGATITFAMTGFSLVVAALARTREQIIPIGLTAVMIVCSIGGCWWPLFQEPIWLQKIAHFFLTAWAMDGIHDLILRERGLLEIVPTLAFLFGYGALCIAVGTPIWISRMRGAR